MHRVNQNSPAPAILKAVFPALFLLLSVFHFAPLAGAQAFGQLLAAAPKVEIPLAPVPQNATVLSAGPGLNVYFINVGQGDAIYLELPGGKNALIDGGPSGSASGPLAGFLKAKNVTHLDNVMLSHPHSDHYNGLNYVLDNIKVDNFYDTRLDNKGAVADETVRAKVSGLGINTVYPAAGDSLDWSAPVAIKVFSACSSPMASKQSETINNCSIVMKLSYNGTSILFTGDLQNDAELSLVQKYGAELKADVLKVGHHGSKYSSTTPFLQAVKPAKAYIEVGKNNYGHPTQDALDRLVKSGAEIFRTDLEDTIEFSVGNAEMVEAAAI
ncbi:MAG: MBL fold metallo-hydrolase [Elusimicrobiales bacterium]|nr:MBL fold metallo-hydrolase [Elusimicrobiales bacterium]